VDILTHAISGTAIAACAAAFVRTTPMRKAKILAAGTLGGFWPDIDAVSMWSRFDQVFGQWFGLEHSGRIIYGSKFWYSHHAFFHSLLASILFGLLLILVIYAIRRMSAKKTVSFKTFVKSHAIYFVVFVLVYWAHLAGDLSTPSSVWGGIALWWPSSDYTGGHGKIWWWNNYDIFLLILFSIIINLTVPAVFKYIRNRKKVFASLVLCTTLVLIMIQINTRQYDYAYSGNTSRYTEMEKNSKKEQRRILGNRLYRYMEWFDRKLPFYF